MYLIGNLGRYIDRLSIDNIDRHWIDMSTDSRSMCRSSVGWYRRPPTECQPTPRPIPDRASVVTSTKCRPTHRPTTYRPTYRPRVPIRYMILFNNVTIFQERLLHIEERIGNEHKSCDRTTSLALTRKNGRQTSLHVLHTLLLESQGLQAVNGSMWKRWEKNIYWYILMSYFYITHLNRIATATCTLSTCNSAYHSSWLFEVSLWYKDLAAIYSVHYDVQPSKRCTVPHCASHRNLAWILVWRNTGRYCIKVLTGMNQQIGPLACTIQLEEKIWNS